MGTAAGGGTAQAPRSKQRVGAPHLAGAVAVLMLGIAAAPLLPQPAEAQQRVVQLMGPKRTGMITINIGKSEDVRTDASFTDVVVGDPEIADVNPLTDKAVSILGRKSGTTRVSMYGEGKKLVGVFDVGVTYDTTLVASEIARRFPYAKLRVSSVNGRIMLSGTAPDGPTVDKAVTLAKQFGPDVINTVQVLSPQQVMLEVRFVEATRQAGRELGVQ